MFLMRQMVFVALLGLMLASPSLMMSADGAPPYTPLTLKINSIVRRARSQAPQTLEISIDCTSPQLFEGRLEIKWYIGKRLVHEYLSHELAITAGGQRWRVALPPIVVHDEKTPVTGYARFIGERETIGLGEVNDLVVPAVAKRAFVVAKVQPHELWRPQAERGIADSLGLEQFNPLPDKRFDLLTYVSPMTPEEMPAFDAGYASFDCLLLEGEGFQKLRRSQLSAIGSWLAAGGSAVIAPRGILSSTHVEFINRLAGQCPGGAESTASEAAYSLDERGQLIVGAAALSAGKKFALLRAGLGRAVIIHENLEAQYDFTSAEWRETVAFLWKVQAGQSAKIVETGHWEAPAARLMTDTYRVPRQFAPERDDKVQSIRQFLLPERIEGVPLTVVVVILTLFLLAVAPGDYFLLGRLNCRKYTWWLFVTTATAFTLGTVKIAEHYMGHADYRTSLTLVDLESDVADSNVCTKVARTSRFELLFVATQRQTETVLRNTLFADLTQRAVLSEQRTTAYRPFMFQDADEVDDTEAVAIDLPVYEGAMPALFTVHQQLRQWSPWVTRQTAFSNEPPPLSESKLDWRALPRGGLASEEGRKSLFDFVREREPDSQIVLLHRLSVFDESHITTPATDRLPEAHEGSLATSSAADDSLPAYDLLSLARDAPSSILPLMGAMSVQQSRGLFAIVSQISPTGGENLEDLALLDVTDTRQWLLIVALRRESRWIVYRQLFYEDP